MRSGGAHEFVPRRIATLRDRCEFLAALYPVERDFSPGTNVVVAGADRISRRSQLPSAGVVGSAVLTSQTATQAELTAVADWTRARIERLGKGATVRRIAADNLAWASPAPFGEQRL